MPNPRRLQMEMKDLHKGVPNVEGITFDEADMTHVKATILPTEPPFNKAKFEVEITYPDKFPFEAPKVKFVTPIYHPNVNEKGTEICLNMINAEHWKPATRTRQSTLIVLPSTSNFLEHAKKHKARR
ncbi:hypothetical protein PTSG_11140 [Salpingoeca rosetta]|uniref:UBC core domain-containing protein n=1 Tax=Salpingoeca rosetta (strain ATCC 50818 / BSB-021) TaxID=946362 RepID=F2USJ3_SALR5|nr:uncharacterized protein PTSG_11140 [Salpingoeca rosetta]EGD81102.1 hypothetical protein PTSG_11140 [Salpingoeca rosetta]|eukprot:XP_004987787.1 hypothetical protein PTSG_11140 [Salpingoeca rosetta]